MSGDPSSVQDEEKDSEESATEQSPVEISVDPTEKPEDPPAAPSEPAKLDPASVWQSPASGGLSRVTDIPDDERRTHVRKGVRLNKLISAELESPQLTSSLYLHLVDISEGGMRVNGDIEFVQDAPFQLKLQTEAFGQEIASEFSELVLSCRVVWQKRLLGGMFVSGLQFVNPTEETQKCIKRVLELCSPEGRRLRFRLNRVLGVGIGLDEQTRWLYPLALDLSVEGMRVRLDEPLQVGEKFPLQIFLEFDLPTVHMTAEVVWKEEVGPSRYQVGFRFSELNEDNARAIQEYIDRCLAKESL